MDAAVAGLVGATVGAIVGAAGSVGGVWLTQRHQTRRDLVHSAVELARQERDERVEKLKSTPGGGPLLPVSVYVAYHAEVLKAIADGKYDAAAVKRIDAFQVGLVEATADRTGRNAKRPASEQ